MSLVAKLRMEAASHRSTLGLGADGKRLRGNPWVMHASLARIQGFGLPSSHCSPFVAVADEPLARSVLTLV